jgi:KipI family sensor histidine kinase inhibitor
VIRPFGEAAYLADTDGPEAARALATLLLDGREPAISGVVPGRRSVLVEVNVASPHLDGIAERIAALAGGPAPAATAFRTRTIPVVYGGEHGPDLGRVADVAGVTQDELVERHASLELRVLFCGFAPGFAYLGDLPEPLDRIRRLATPRTRTAAGSVALADGMSGIYPAELPGGWPVIGRTPVVLFDPQREPPAYLVPGDRVLFRPIGAEAWDRLKGAPADW